MSNPQHALTLLEQCPVWDGLDGGTLVVACSGGRDSTALARAAAELLSRTEFRSRFKSPPQLVVWHLDHGLRIESPEDAAFVESLALQLDAPVIVEHAQLSKRLAEQGGNLEAVAREERYSRLRALSAGTSPAATLKQPVRAMTAHHLSDQAETVLHHLVRGTHLAGLAGIAPVNDDGVYRPWLTLRPELLEDYLASLGQEYREDASNFDTQRTRSRIRYEVMPVLLSVNPNAREHIARLASTARSAQAWVDERLQQLNAHEIHKSRLLRWLPLADWPEGDLEAWSAADGWPEPGLLAAFISRLLTQRCGSLSSDEHIQISDWSEEAQQLLRLRGLSICALGDSAILLWEDEKQLGFESAIQLIPNKPLHLSGLEVQLGGAHAEHWEAQRKRARSAWESYSHFPSAFERICAEEPPELSWHCYLPQSVNLPLSLRRWREGERFELAGGGSKTIGDIFTDAKVPRIFRPNWTLLVDAEDRPLWLPGLANGALMQMDAEHGPAYSIVIRSGDA